MDKHFRLTYLAPIVLFAHAASVHAAFFQLAENSPAGLGSAFAGGAALAEDASAVWYNPAGLVRLSGRQLVAGGHYIVPSMKFSKTSATHAVNGAVISGGNGGDAGVAALVPNFYYAQPIDDRLSFGLGVNAPFGLATDYDDNWVGRYHANRSEIKTVNLNPALGYKLNDTLSLGAGINFQKMEAELTQAVDFGSLCVLRNVSGCATPGAYDGQANVKADDDTWGYNAGLLWQATPATRLGFAYRSKMKYLLKGNFSVTAPSATAAAAGATVGIVDSGAQADITLPETMAVSVFHQIDSAWAVMGDITRTKWSRLPELRIEFTGSSTQSDSVTTLDLEDSDRYALGALYTTGVPWTYRAGIAFDQTPTPSEDARPARLPDANRTWLSFGAGYRQSDKLSFDFAYTHIKFDEAKIRKSATPGSENFLRGNLVGDYRTNIHVLSAQVQWMF